MTKKRSSEVLRDEIKFVTGKLDKSRKNTTICGRWLKKVIRIFEGWNLNFQGIFGLKYQEGNISFEMCSHEFFLKHALLSSSIIIITTTSCRSRRFLCKDDTEQETVTKRKFVVVNNLLKCCRSLSLSEWKAECTQWCRPPLSRPPPRTVSRPGLGD